MIGPFFAAFLQPIVGFISDKLKATKQTLLLLLILTGICAFGLFYVSSMSLSIVLIIGLFMFFLSAIPLIDTLSVRAARDLNSTYSNIRLWGSIGFCIIAVFLGMYFDFIGGLRALVYIYFPIWLFTLIILYNLQDNTKKADNNFNKALTVKEIIPILSNKRLLFFLLSGNLMRRFHPLKLIIASALLYIIRWSCHVYFSDPYIILVLQLFQAVTYSLFWASAVTYLNEMVPEKFRATSQSLLSMIFLGLSGIIGGSVGGVLHQNLGGSYMYLFAVILAFISCLGFVLISRNSSSSKPNYGKIGNDKSL
ncbi:putative 3-phenylpropionic acid transporter [compost metagenome]